MIVNKMSKCWSGCGHLIQVGVVISKSGKRL